MKVKTKDGRVLVGSHLQILQEMRSLAFVPTMSIAEYARWVATTVETQTGVRPNVVEGDDNQIAESLVTSLIEIGLLERLQ